MIRIRVLIVDDSENDALLLADELRESNLDPEYLRVDTPAAMKSALDDQAWDLIIADYKMPQFSGPEALKVLQDSGLDVPFILVSGTAEENTGIDMMRAGAQDFILKHSLSRLSPAVSRELGEADVRKQRKRAEDSARTSAENYRRMFEYAPVPIVTYDRDAVVIQVNPAFEHLFGFTDAEVAGRHMWETFGLRENAQRSQDETSQIFTGEIVRNAEYKDVRKDGAFVYVLANITPVYDEKNNIVMALAMITDITERKLAEERERERETQMQEFYRRTILAATDGKLLVCEKEFIYDAAGLEISSWKFRDKDELSIMRDAVNGIVRKEGMEESRVPYLLGCVVEAAANAIKHAGEGRASLYRKLDRVMYIVSDSGPGIQALALPDVALIRGYSTAGVGG